MKPFSYYVKREQWSVALFQQKRDALFRPLVRFLAFCNLTPDMLTLFGFLLLLGIPFFIASPPYAFLFLLGHLFVDGLDGSLARFTKKASSGESFFDAVIDHTGFVVVLIVLSYASLANPLVVSLYIYLYTLMTVLLLVSNSFSLPATFVIRSKAIIYFLFFLWAFFSIEVFTEALLLFSVLMIPQIVQSILALKEYLSR